MIHTSRVVLESAASTMHGVVPDSGVSSHDALGSARLGGGRHWGQQVWSQQALESASVEGGRRGVSRNSGR